MADLTKGKIIRVKANVANTPVYRTQTADLGGIYKYFKGGEEIGIATGIVTSDDLATYEMVEVVLDHGTASSWLDLDYLPEFGYVLMDDVDVLGQDVAVNDGTVVIDKNGNEIGTLSKYPNAVKVNKTNKEGKDIYILVDSQPPIDEPTSQRPKWLTFALWTLAVTGVATCFVVLYKSLSK